MPRPRSARERERRQQLRDRPRGWRPFGDGWDAWYGLPVEEIEQATGAVMRDWLHDEGFSAWEDAWDDAHPVVRRMITVTGTNGTRANGTQGTRTETRWVPVDKTDNGV